MIHRCWFNNAAAIFVGLATVSLTLIAQDSVIEEAPSTKFRGGYHRSVYPLAELPPNIQAQGGKITLWADFSDRDEQGVPLYLVNNTNEDKQFRSQDGDLFIKLEYKDADGIWKRAQIHKYSDCGNSYVPVTLRARQYFKICGYRAKSGPVKPVRYGSMYGGIFVSNVGEGRIADADLKAVSVDEVTRLQLPSEIGESLWKFGEHQSPDAPPLKETPLDLNPTPEQRRTAIRSLMAFPRNTAALSALRDIKPRALLLPDSEGKDRLLSAINEVLAYKWPATSPGRNAVDVCVDRLKGNAASKELISEELAWDTIRWALYRTNRWQADRMENPNYWKDIIPLAVKRVEGTGESMEESGAQILLNSAWIVDAQLKDEEVRAWVVSPSAVLRYAGAAAMARRTQYAQLTEIAWKLPLAAQVQILKALATCGNESGIARCSPEWSEDDNERRFWIHCATAMPVETANALMSWEHGSNGNTLDRILHDPIRKFWEAEARKKAQDEDITAKYSEYQLNIAFRMFESWKMPEDDALLEELLKHNAIGVNSGMYFIRDLAKKALMARGKPVSQDVVLKPMTLGK